MASVTYCSAYGCLNTTTIKPEYAFFSLPSDANRCQKWLHLISREDLNGRPTKSYFVCEEHFKPSDVMKSARRKVLKKTAYPCFSLPEISKSKSTQTCVLTKVDKSINTGVFVTIVKHSATQTKASLSGNTSSKRKLLLNDPNNKKKKPFIEIKDMTVKNQKYMFHNLCNKFLTKDLAKLVKAQTYLKFRSCGNRFNEDYMEFCQKIYHTSPQVYHLLESILCLPCTKTLKMKQRITEMKPMITEMNQVITEMNQVITEMNQNSKSELKQEKTEEENPLMERLVDSITLK